MKQLLQVLLLTGDDLGPKITTTSRSRMKRVGD